LALLGIGFMLLALLHSQTNRLPNAIYTTLIFGALIISIHLRRGDKLFFRINFKRHKWIYFVEYLIISLALIISLLIHNYWHLALMAVAMQAHIILPGFEKKQMNINTPMHKWIPDECFEWKSGLRNLFSVIPGIWIAGILFSFFVGSVPIAMVLLGIISLNFFEKGESYQMVIAFEKGPNKFLFLKVKQHLAIFSAISVPLILSFMIFHYDLWYIPLIIYLAFSMLQVYAIVLKYSFYEPNTKLSAVSIFHGIGLICLIIPFLAPLIILLSLRFYLKAKKNLSYYLNDYH
jgi:hypothetical protein